jgi:Flp pilus assembly protein TadD
MIYGFVSVLLLAFTATIAHAVDSGLFPDPFLSRAPVATAESQYNQGLEFAKKNDWRKAGEAYREATRLKPTMPEAWNGLGYSLRKLGRYDESIKAYQEALKLRPQYSQALEYLGEAYVRMGKLDEAKKVLERLRPLDPREADELALVIGKAAAR